MNIFKSINEFFGNAGRFLDDLNDRATDFMEEKKIRSEADEFIKTDGFSSDMERAIMLEAGEVECQRKSRIAAELASDPELATFYSEAWARVQGWAAIGTVRALRDAEGCAMQLAVHRREMGAIMSRRPDNQRRCEAAMDDAYKLSRYAMQSHAGVNIGGVDELRSSNVSHPPVETAFNVFERLTAVAVEDNKLAKGILPKSACCSSSTHAPVDVVDELSAHLYAKALETREWNRVESLMALAPLDAASLEDDTPSATQSAIGLFGCVGDRRSLDHKSDLASMFQEIRNSNLGQKAATKTALRSERNRDFSVGDNFSSDQNVGESVPTRVINLGCLGVDGRPLPTGFRATRMTISGPGFPTRTIDLAQNDSADSNSTCNTLPILT